MKKIIIYGLIILLVFSFTSCTVTKNKIDMPSRTYMIYLNGSDLETDYGVATEDLKEILSTDISPSTRILVYTGGTERWNNQLISDSKNEIYEVVDGGLDRLVQINQKNMGSAETLKEFIIFATGYAPADEHYLIMWNHGGGAISGFGSDENYKNNSLLLNEMSTALKEAKEETKINFEFIAFDACLMASLENIVSLKDVCDYVIASEELVPASGFNYKDYFKKEKDILKTEELGKLICDEFYRDAVKSGAKDNLTMSVLKTENADALVDKFDLILSELSYTQKAKDKPMINEDLFKTMTFGAQNQNEGYSNMLDLQSLCKNLKTKDNTKYEKLKESIDEVCIYKKNGILNKFACGISVYFPKYLTEYVPYELKQYERVSFSERYTDSLIDYTIQNDFDAKDQKVSLIDETTFYKIYSCYDEGKDISYRLKENKITKNKEILFTVHEEQRYIVEDLD